jgi:uncharacterized membrane protein (DUF4010 family)
MWRRIAIGRARNRRSRRNSRRVAMITTRPEWSLLIALTIGLLIGVERERHNRDNGDVAAAGMRTFAIVALIGAIAAMIGNAALIAAVAVFVGVAALVSHVLGPRKDLGMTGEMALVATFVLGVLAVSNAALAMVIGVVVTALLAFRNPLHRFARDWLSDQELLDGLTFAVAAIVILPVLPDRAVDPYGLVNPFALWRLAVVVMAMSSLGYVAQRLAGARYGLLIAGLAAGLVSSTAAVMAMGARSRDDAKMSGPAAAGAVASLIGSLGYLVVVIGAISFKLLLALAMPLAFAVVCLLAYAVVLVRGAPAVTGDVMPAGRAFNTFAVLIFVAMVGGFSMISELLLRVLGTSGVLVGAAAMGLADAHAAAASTAALSAGGRIGVAAGTMAVLLALTTNMAIKIPVGYVAGSRSFAWRVTGGAVLLIAALWTGFAVAGR